ncbi:hypothetical protein WAI453_013569 [Rhynchosporium graminicola]
MTEEEVDIPGIQILHGRSISTLSVIATSLVLEPASIRVPYQGEDARVTLLRNFDDQLQEWAAPRFARSSMEKEGRSDNNVIMSLEIARLY